jgi:DNA-binding NtrC family response regulator
MADILIVDDDRSIATAFERFLGYEGHACRIASNVADALRLVGERRPSLIMMDVRMPGVDGLQGLEQVRAQFPDVSVVIMTAYGTSQTSIDAIRAGAFDYLTKPLDLDHLRSVIDKALAAQQTRGTSDADRAELPDLHAAPLLVGDSPAMLAVYKMIGRLSTNDVPALIVGERGAGKHLVVATVHDNSARRDQPLTVIDSGLPDVALDTDLFSRQSGTIHLAHVDALPAGAQSRLARALSEQSRPHQAGPRLGARILASTDRDLAEHVRAGQFSRELFDTLAVITLELPPLRERREDIPLLVRYFIQRFNAELNRSISGVDDETVRLLQAYAWPANVGELARIVKRACIVARTDVITADDLGGSLSGGRFGASEDVESSLSRAVRAALHERLVETSEADAAAASPFHGIVDLVETTLVKEALVITNGNQVKAADILGVNRATLRKKMPD